MATQVPVAVVPPGIYIGPTGQALVVTQQSGTTYTFALANTGTVVESTSATAATFTIPLNSSVGFGVPTEITVVQGGAGALTVAGAAGVTVNGVSAGTVTASAQYGAVTLIQTAVNVWVATTTGGGSGGAVSSVFTRTGAVVATSGDYTVGQVTGAAPLASPALTGTPTTTVTENTSVHAPIASLFDVENVWNVLAFGATGNTLTFSDGAITSGLHAFTSALATFTAGDVGKVIEVKGAGAAGAKLLTTISAYTSAHAVTLTAAAGTTVTAAIYIYGTDDTTAVQVCLNASVTQTGVCFFPSGHYLCGPLTIPPGAVLQGVGAQSYYYQGGTFLICNYANLSMLTLRGNSATPLFSPNDGGTYLSCGVRIRDLMLNCNGMGFANKGTAIDLPDSGVGIPRFWVIERCYVFYCGTAGGNAFAINLGAYNEACTLRDCVIFGIGQIGSSLGGTGGDNGVRWYGTDCTMEDCFIGDFGTYGLFVEGGANSYLTGLVHGGGIFGNGFANVALGGGGMTFDGVSIDSCTGAGGGFYAAVAAVNTISNCQFEDNTGGPNINVQATGVILTMHGNRCFVSGATPYHIATGGNAGTYIDIGTVVPSGFTFTTAYCDHPTALLTVGSNGQVLNFPVNAPTVTAGAVTLPITSRIDNITVSATTAITITATGAQDGQLKEVRILDGGTPETLSWPTNTENSTVAAPTTSNGSATLPLSVLWQFNGATSKWRCLAAA